MAITNPIGQPFVFGEGGGIGFIQEYTVKSRGDMPTEVSLTIIVPPGLTVEDVLSSSVFRAEVQLRDRQYFPDRVINLGRD